ncbi:MAG TPA: peptidase M52 [Clostridiales bacterium]|nr:peptidase M52 [Clostridiales bacterium]
MGRRPPLGRVLVVGIGNPILRDDAVGLVVVREVKRRLEGSGLPVTFVEASVGGLDLIDLLSGYDAALLVDAAVTGRAAPGEVFELDIGFLEDTTHLGTAGLSHQVDLATAWKLGRRLGLPLPRVLRVLAVEAADVKTFSEELSPSVAENLPRVVEAVTRVVREVVAACGCGAAPGEGGSG